MTELQAAKHRDNPFDVTKVWSQKEYPLLEVGVVELNKNPENYFADVEQAAFAPANIVAGIGFSPDKMLQTRLFMGAACLGAMKRCGMNALGSRQRFSCRCSSQGAIRITSFGLTANPATVSAP